MVDLLPPPSLPPAAEGVVDGLPGRQIMREQPPGTAGPQPVGHGVDQLATVMQGWAAARLGRGDEWSEQLPLGIGQVGGIGAAGPGSRAASSSWTTGQPRIIRAFQTPSKFATAKVERATERGTSDRSQARERQAERGDFNDAPPTY
jgi:hypothetical protein